VTYPPLLVQIKKLIDFRRADRGNFPPAVRGKCRNKLENSSLMPIIWMCFKVHDEGPRQDKATKIRSESGHSTR
jgi:hypothetical protein